MQLVCRDRNRLALQSDIVGASMHGIENLRRPHRRRRHRGRRARGQARLRPRQPAAHRASRSTLAEGRYLSGRPLEPRAAPVPRRRREPGRPAGRVPRRARAHEGARRRALPAAADRLRPELLERFVAAAEAAGLTERAALIPSITILRSAERPALHRREGPGHRGPRRGHRARRGGRRPAGGVLRARPRAGHPRALAARRRRPAPHLVPQGRGHRPALHTARPRAAHRKGEVARVCTRPCRHALAPSSSATTSRSASSASASTPRGARRSPRSCAAATSRR